MPVFYPSIDFDEPAVCDNAGEHAERRVLEALQELEDKWRIFHCFEWRDFDDRAGERAGEADLILFHPDLGILVIEIKGGGVAQNDGEWWYVSLFDGTRHKMDMSPLSQARRNRYYLYDKLKGTSLGHDILPHTAFTHTAWFPDITWQGDLPPELPSGAFVLDFRHLNNPAQHIRKILRLSNPHAKRWSQAEIALLVRTLAPEVNLLPPLGIVLGTLRDKLFKMTQGQLNALRALRKQKRLLVEGCAGSGKTLLAVTLAREHVGEGKRVLFTCFNKNLAEFVAGEFKGLISIDAFNFHELVRRICEKVGVAYAVPEDEAQRRVFFDSECAELLDRASQLISEKYDTIIVDEAFDFRETWWIALLSLGCRDCAVYAFYDRNQNVFNEGSQWRPPFEAEPIVLDMNVRNTRPVGEIALKLGKIREVPKYAVNQGPDPEIKTYGSVEEVPVILKGLVSDLITKRKVPPDEIVVLSPYKYDSKRLGIKDLIDSSKDLFTLSMGKGTGKIRVGTIQAFKGLEADVVILCGIDGHLPACSPANLYVGATRARVLLQVISQRDYLPHMKNT